MSDFMVKLPKLHAELLLRAIDNQIEYHVYVNTREEANAYAELQEGLEAVIALYDREAGK